MIGIVTNPKATRNRRNRNRIKRLERILGQRGMIREAIDLEAMSAIAEEFIAANIDVLGVDGGDGTLHHTLTAFLDVYGDRDLPYVIHLKGGAMNTIAKSIGMRGSSERILRDIVEKYDRKHDFETAAVDLLKVNDKYGFIFGAGFAANLLEAYYEGEDTGPPKAVKTVLKAFYSIVGNTERCQMLFQPIKADVYVNGKKLPFEEYTFILCCTVKQVGLGFKPSCRAEDGGDFFHFLGGSMGAKDLLWRAPKLYQGIPLGDERLYDSVAREAIIRLERLQKYTIDGEIFDDWKGKITLQVGPKIRFIKG